MLNRHQFSFRLSLSFPLLSLPCWSEMNGDGFEEVGADWQTGGHGGRLRPIEWVVSVFWAELVQQNGGKYDCIHYSFQGSL